MSETTETEIPESSPPQPVEPPSQPAAGAGEGEGANRAEETPPPSQAAEPPQPDWRDKRIATLTRRLRELQQQPQQPPQQPPQSQVPEQALIDQRARELAAIQDFNRRCDETALSGRAQFGEEAFNGRISNLQKLSDPTDQMSVQQYNNLLLAALETGEADRLLYELGADLNEAQRILGMSPTKMAVELTKRATKPPVQVSTAPRPITPVGGRPASHERIEPDDPDRSDHLSTSEWMRRREAQLSAKAQSR